MIIDSSALVALLDPRDQHHRWARAVVADLPLPWLTCEAVVVETLFLLARTEGDRLCRLLRDGRLRVTFGLRDEVKSILDLRENPGGLLNEGVAVAGRFLQNGQSVVSHRGRASARVRLTFGGVS